MSKLKFDWHEGTAVIATESGPVETMAFRTCMIPYLAVTYSGGGFWALTHEPSGMALGGTKHDRFFCFSWALAFAETHCASLDFFAMRPGKTPAELEEFAYALYDACEEEEDALSVLFEG